MSQVVSEKVKILSLLQVEQGISRSLETAKELLDAAKLLNKKGYHSLSQAISILAIEERGKAVLLYRTILFEDDPNKWKQFWSDFLGHKPKILAGIWPWSDNFFNLEWDTQFGKFITENQVESIKGFNFDKQSGFYTQFDSDEKTFKGIETNLLSIYFSLSIIENLINLVTALFKEGYFKTTNLELLQNAFLSERGKQMLDKYRRSKRLRSDPQFSKEYDDFLNEYNLTPLRELKRKALISVRFIDNKFSIFKLLPEKLKSKIFNYFEKTDANMRAYRRKQEGWLD